MNPEPLLLRLLLLHETVVGYGSLAFAEVLAHAQRGVEWVFEGGRLEVLPPEAARGLPGRGRVPGGYGAYFAGPPKPLYLRLEHPRIEDPTELRLAALYLDYLLSALKGAGYREELERQARYDWLTGLGNRRAFERRMAQGLPEGWGLAMLDLDDLKRINDTQGHLAGDRLLIALARALQEGGLKAYRLAGDEFAVILSREALPALQHTLQGFAVSLGVAWAEEGQGQALLALADARMYEHKRRRKAAR
ncbi:MAG: GGDEF domain-containing protein [Meiothermus silvanus]|nr:GGDEF domain-containing protein [Allomeiothermus silvanus]